MIMRNIYSIGVFLDLQKLFDTINHDILHTTKLEIYDISGITSFLKDRKQYTTIQGIKSN